MLETLELNETKPTFKLPIVSIPSDDCVIHLNQVIEDGPVEVDGKPGKPIIVYEGDPYYLHKGESVQCSPITSVGEYIAISKLAAIDESGAMGDRLLDVCQALSQTILGWDWTDLAGKPMASPYNNPRVLMQLSNEEVMYLLMVGKRPAQETGDERKNV